MRVWLAAFCRKRAERLMSRAAWWLDQAKRIIG
jgi:cytidylate kinase